MVDRLIRRLVRILPRRVVMWCGYRIGAHATQGKYSDQSVPDLLFMDAMERWREQEKVNGK